MLKALDGISSERPLAMIGPPQSPEAVNFEWAAASYHFRGRPELWYPLLTEYTRHLHSRVIVTMPSVPVLQKKIAEEGKITEEKKNLSACMRWTYVYVRK